MAGDGELVSESVGGAVTGTDGDPVGGLGDVLSSVVDELVSGDVEEVDTGVDGEPIGGLEDEPVSVGVDEVDSEVDEGIRDVDEVIGGLGDELVSADTVAEGVQVIYGSVVSAISAERTDSCTWYHDGIAGSQAKNLSPMGPSVSTGSADVEVVLELVIPLEEVVGVVEEVVDSLVVSLLVSLLDSVVDSLVEDVESSSGVVSSPPS